MQKSRVLTFRSICVTIFVRLDKRNDEESTQKEVLQRSPIRLRGMDGRLRKMASEWCGSAGMASVGEIMPDNTVNLQWVRPLQRHGVMHQLRLLP